MKYEIWGIIKSGSQLDTDRPIKNDKFGDEQKRLLLIGNYLSKNGFFPDRFE